VELRSGPRKEMEDVHFAEIESIAEKTTEARIRKL